MYEHDSNLDYKDILENTRDIAFIVVQHQGSESACWVSLSANLLKSANIGTPTNTALVSSLVKGSITLATISNQLVDRARDMMIYTF